MTFFKTLAVAFSTYSALPMPQFPWEEQNMRYAICVFPLVGVVCGGALLLWSRLCGLLGVGGILFAAVAACLPLLITGGIHMDGFMDTVDALASRQSRERKLEIMKDSACGAFAAIYCGVYLLLSFGLYHQIGSIGLGGGLIFGENQITVPKQTLRYRGESLCGHNDHRIVMSLAVLLTLTGGSIEGAQAVRKSFPDFFEKLQALGIKLTTE